MRRAGIAGLAMMALVLIAAMIWPIVATVMFGVLVAVLSVVLAVPVGLAARWVRGELACRRELRAMTALDVPAFDAAPAAVPTLRELRESA